jgi:UDP-3-O-[3-hydroxymyristoyl] glucosamine N-acyltransferase
MTTPGRPAAATTLTLAELAGLLEAELLGGGGVRIAGVAGLSDAGPGDLVRVDSPRYLAEALASPAAALLVGPRLDAGERPALRVADPRVAFARALELFYPERRPPAGIDPSARLGADVSVGEECAIGPYVVLGDRVVLGRGVVLHPFVCLADDVQVGDGSVLFPHVTLYERVVVGRRVRIHSGAVIGADGFGYVPDRGGVRKVPQVGSVVIEDEVEIGANSAVDRATTGVTRIGAGAKIDNLVQIGHNTSIGRGCLIASQVGISGSCVLEDGVIIGGQAGLKDHVLIGRGTVVSARAGVWGDLPPGGVVSGLPARPHREELRAQAEVARLAETTARLRALERRLEEVEARLGAK